MEKPRLAKGMLYKEMLGNRVNGGTVMGRNTLEEVRVLWEQRVGITPPVEPARFSRRERAMFIGVAVGIFTISQLWATGIILGLVAKLFM